MSETYLKTQLERFRHRINVRYNYYEMKNRVSMYDSILPKELKHLSTSLGWCGKAVDTLADRLSVYGFKNDSFNIWETFQLNNADILIDSAILSALIGSCSFIYISQDEDGYPRYQVIDGYDATGIIDPITNMLKEGYAILEKDENGNTILSAYFEKGKTTFTSHITGESAVIENVARYPLLVPMIYRADARRPFGRSRISRACMKYTDFAIKNILLSSVSSEYYAFPQKWISGLDEDTEIDTRRASLTDMLALTSGDNGNPTLGQFSTSSMTPYIDTMRMYASLFAGETGLTIDDLGFVQDNPSSAEAIKASHENLRLYARKAQKGFGTGLLNTGFLGASLRDGISYKRQALYETKTLWEPIFEPDMTTLGVIGDGALKLNQAIPNFIGSENLRALTGIEGNDNE